MASNEGRENNRTVRRKSRAFRNSFKEETYAWVSLEYENGVVRKSLGVVLSMDDDNNGVDIFLWYSELHLSLSWLKAVDAPEILTRQEKEKVSTCCLDPELHLFSDDLALIDLHWPVPPKDGDSAAYAAALAVAVEADEERVIRVTEVERREKEANAGMIIHRCIQRMMERRLGWSSPGVEIPRRAPRRSVFSA